ncbi:hypothetical protein C8N46_105187 [Kordia periserrulae]|uniref:Secreted protein n=1 Tax=Kordia periserrulae TaxID=701523 RepID=A0A2T6BY74_9FLAO|nr:hypothetical protein [Kordia periserrulae]PTX61031.1 hypothetical protein C8N46_105187 [Kordia periserrulae]
MKTAITVLLVFITSFALAQTEHEPTEMDPYGTKNPKAPKQLDDFKPMIGICDCDSQRKNPDGSWAAPVQMTWKFKYIMNGMAIQDETLKADGRHSGSIRQFHKDSLKWYVHYYTSASPTPTLGSWEGSKTADGKIVLYKPQKAPNGMDGFSRLTFYDITETGYKWIGEWVDPKETMSFPFWKISCTKREE